MEEKAMYNISLQRQIFVTLTLFPSAVQFQRKMYSNTVFVCNNVP